MKKKQGQIPQQDLIKGDMFMTNNRDKRFSKSSFMRQCKITDRCLTEWPKPRRFSSLITREDMSNRTLIHCWWESKMMQTLWKTEGGFLQNCMTKLSSNQSYSLLTISKSWKHIHTKNCMCTFIEVLFINFQNLEATKMSFNR